MKLSKATIEVLKNFSDINQSLLFNEGTKIKTMNSLKNILAHANVVESFPKQFAIYDLNEFLGYLSTMDNPELSFEENHIKITDQEDQDKYVYANTDYIVSPQKDIKVEDYTFKVNIKEDVFRKIDKKTTILQLHDLYLKGCDISNNIFLCASNKKNDSSNEISIKIGEGVTKKFNVVLKKENLKIIPGDYDISISSKGIAHFKNEKIDLEYWIALEPDSEYGE
tara:strand:- start:338 stop:1009 length:672 start_codon:yes stop_codon:yes gene_type:complete